MTLFKAVLLAVLACLIQSSPLEGGQFNQIKQKQLITAFVCGLVMVDIETAMKIGVPVQAMYLGAMAIGGVATMPSANVSLWFIIPSAIAAGLDAEAAIGLAIPFAVVETAERTLESQLRLIPHHLSIAAYSKGDLKKGLLFGNGGGYLLQWIPKLIIIITGNMIGQDIMIAIANNMPAWLTKILSNFSSMCPLVGFSLLLGSLITSQLQWIYVIIGFTCIKVLNMSILQVTMIGLFVAYLYYQLSGNQAVAAPAVSEEEDY